MKYLFFLLFILSLYSCGSTNKLQEKSNSSFGYSQSNPILVGGENLSDGPLRQRQYLENLTGPRGERIFYKRLGSCCEFETDNSPFGGGLLDRYEITYAGLKEPIILFFNMYDPPQEEVLVPEGLKLHQD